MPEEAIGTQLQAGQGCPEKGDVSGGLGTPVVFLDVVFVSVAASCPFAQCPRSSSARR